MKVFEADITLQVSIHLNDFLRSIDSFEIANQMIHNSFGIIHFFENDIELEILKETISDTHTATNEIDRSEYGDFQTNIELAVKATRYLIQKNISPEIVIEPTCGKGNFIIASLQNFSNIQNIFGVEIYKPYVWETKFNIINHFIEHPNNTKPEINIIHNSVFDFDFDTIVNQFPTSNFLVIGNPPWVTNSELSSLNSSNLPEKTNFKNHKGLDAMTGKGNFDIAEYINLMMLNSFQSVKGNLMFLVKNTVIKNIIFDQTRNNYRISSIEKLCIDSKKEFDVAVEASFLFCKLNQTPKYFCSEFNFYENGKSYVKFGWLNDKYVSNIDTYIHTANIDGECPFVWRQGIKHDCTKVMELDKVNDNYVNALGVEVQLEDGLVYGLLKSSDLKNTVINQVRKYTIVTQKKPGQETDYIREEFPQTYNYLISHLSHFDARKSSIYKGKPAFSIFGVGDYSFKPYKVAISGMYKSFHFTLVLPQENKPVMLDDTCYLLGFDRIEFAVYALILLNSNSTMQFLQSITFSDAKRTFTKDVLMRINILELANRISLEELQTELDILNEKYNLILNLDTWDAFISEMTPVPKVKAIKLSPDKGQLAMF